ncbi:MULTISPECIES: hypothetical protein [unclassified Undibacterium]|nr:MULTISPECIES: hypothetical protein [unclassified Undibacterium]MEB0216753.1 hypothetical protein [Undibacterium sp. 5I2]MEB0140576.1 hypothetical protein [Undibacterium sp. CCC2.1]MEB0173630.1 hypothetical protein [Undibacterium sp. CCC1.1]MEB0177342.1 hypothetical protein [Undibacterium sp. CCC3.4]WPX44567.1 hypothetical protein RHM61_04880 [Undibacterium sp. CCC3.4]
MKIIFILCIFFFSCHVTASDRTASDVALKWVDIEVITNQFDQINEVKKVSGLRPGFTAALSDPLLRSACNRIRTKYKTAKINCRGISMEGASALYVVEISDLENSDSIPDRYCSEVKVLPPESVILLENWKLTLEKQLASPESGPISEYINDNHFLDYRHSELHEFALALYREISLHMSRIDNQVASCISEERENVINLLNFLGDPNRAIRIAETYLADEDASVRNSAFRLLASFSKYITVRSSQHLLDLACNNLRNTTFTDRNKSLVLISELLTKKTLQPIQSANNVDS